MIGKTDCLISSAGRAPDLQAGGRGFESCIGHTFSSLVYFIFLEEHTEVFLLINRINVFKV